MTSSETWTLTPIIRRFNNHKESNCHEEGSEKSSRNVGKNMGYVAGEGEFENGGQEPLEPQKRAQKIWQKCFWKSIGKCIIRRFNNHQESQSP